LQGTMRWISFPEGTAQEGEEGEDEPVVVGEEEAWTPMRLVAAEMGCHVNKAMSQAEASRGPAGGFRLASPVELQLLKSHGLLHPCTVRSMLCSRTLGRELLQRRGRAEDVHHDAAARASPPPSRQSGLGPGGGDREDPPPQLPGGRACPGVSCTLPLGPMSTWSWDPDLAPVRISKMSAPLLDRVQRGLREAGGKYMTPALEAFLRGNQGDFTAWYDTREGSMQLDRDRGTGGGSSTTHGLQDVVLRHILFVSEKLRPQQALSWEVLVDPAQVAEWVSFLMAREVKSTTVATYLERLTRYQSYVGTLSQDRRPSLEYMASLTRWTRRVTCHFRGLLDCLKDRDTILERKSLGR